MKEIFEIKLKGNLGCTIKDIKSFSKHEEFFDRGSSRYTKKITYTFELEYHNGKKEEISFYKIEEDDLPF